MNTSPDLDLAIIGTGIAGIAVAHYVRQLRMPEPLKIKLFEKRSHIGGTWDIFRYPGVRSDSDMGSYSFSFAPFEGTRPLAPGSEILAYLENTLQAEGLADDVVYNHPVTTVDFDSTQGHWVINGTTTARFIHLATGYFVHEHGNQPTLPGQETFTGTIVDPQCWPEQLDWQGKKIVVVGSGATAATLIPHLAEHAEVTMLQRSPSHMAPTAHKLPPLPTRVERWRAIAENQLLYKACRTFPTVAAKALIKAREAFIDKDTNAQHFTPNYPVWDQRVCRVPDGDLFQTLAAGKARVVTDTIQCFEPGGIRTNSGELLEADIVVLATGLIMQPLGNIDVRIDGHSINVSERRALRGMMLEEVPNLSFTLGYVNDSYTLRAELVGKHLARVLRTGTTRFTPAAAPQDAQRLPIVDLQSGYVLRGIAAFPPVTDHFPWTLRNSYMQEVVDFQRQPFAALELERRPRTHIMGPDDAAHTVVAIHGIGRGLEDFVPLQEALVQQRNDVRFICVDIPGFGFSMPLKRSSLPAIAAALWEHLETLGVGDGNAPVTLVGNSLGGTVAMAMACQHPERVRATMLLAPSGFSTEITKVVAVAAKPLLGDVLFAAMTPSMVDKVEEKTVFDHSYKRTALGIALAAHPSRAATMKTLSRQLVQTPPAHRMDLGKRFATLHIPTVLCWGEEDGVLAIDQLDTAEQVLPHAEVHRFAHCGHMPQIERTEEIARLLSDLIDKQR